MRVMRGKASEPQERFYIDDRRPERVSFPASVSQSLYAYACMDDASPSSPLLFFSKDKIWLRSRTNHSPLTIEPKDWKGKEGRTHTSFS